MISTALQDLFGGKAAEAALLALFHHGQAYGGCDARDLAVSLDSVQRQLDRLAELVCPAVSVTAKIQAG